MLNHKQLDVGEKLLINIANVVSATFVVGIFLNSEGFNWKIFAVGCTLYVLLAVAAFWWRRGGRK